MAWLTEYSATNKINDSARDYIESLYFGGQTWTRTVTVGEYSYVGMTESAADSCVTALNNPPEATASKQRENAAGAYMVKVSGITYGAWEV